MSSRHNLLPCSTVRGEISKGPIDVTQRPVSQDPQLTELRRLAGQVVDLDLEQSDLIRMNRYSTEARYPGDWEPITRNEAEEVVAMTRKVRALIIPHLPSDVTRDLTRRNQA